MIGLYLKARPQNINKRMRSGGIRLEKWTELWDQKFPSSRQQHRDHCRLNNNHIWSWNRMRCCVLPGESNLWKALLKRSSFTTCGPTWWERDTGWDLTGKSIWVQRDWGVCRDVPLWCGKVALEKNTLCMVLIACHSLPPAQPLLLGTSQGLQAGRDKWRKIIALSPYTCEHHNTFWQNSGFSEADVKENNRWSTRVGIPSAGGCWAVTVLESYVSQ